MDKLQAMTVFVTVAEAQSFAGAARRLAMSPPAVTRAITALEERLKVKLLQRTTRLVRVTDAGQRYLEDAKRILADVDAADEAAAGINAEPAGQLAVTAPAQFGKLYVMPGIVDYLQRYPAMQVTALFVDRVVNLLEEGMDVGIRIGELPDSSLRAVRVGQVRPVVCAAPDYLQRHGAPNDPSELAKHTLIAAGGLGAGPDWRFGSGADAHSVRIQPRLVTSTIDAAIEAAVQGLGLTRLLSYQIAPYLASGQLQTVLNRHEPPPIPIHVLHREGRYASAKVRSFVDLIAERLKREARWL
ncbi:LysR family transcriptional regulator [Methylomonas sp. HW2-6]|uniref:LysR family transcriptional regulator n=1 Tax=Methylomonas sp. HW2-6 TaxID=3376687 RepID=UPI004041BCCF